MVPNVTCLTRLFLVVDVTPVTEYTPSGYQSLLLTNLQKLEESEKGECALKCNDLWYKLAITWTQLTLSRLCPLF